MMIAAQSTTNLPNTAGLSRDDIQKIIRAWLVAQNYYVHIIKRGTDIDIYARRDTAQWIIEAREIGLLRESHFLLMLGETLQRMMDMQARYSIALPDLPKFRRFWACLPALAKERTGITALFVDSAGNIEECS